MAMGVLIYMRKVLETSARHMHQGKASFFHWLTSVGFRVSDWNNLLLHQIKQNLSKQRPAHSCISFQCLWMPLSTSH